MTDSRRLAWGRVWPAAPLALSLLSLLMAGLGAAQPASSAEVPPSSTGQGWYWQSRPEPLRCPEGAPPECALLGDPVAQQNQIVFALDHLYVGWDPLERKAEMVTALNFDLLDAGVAPGSPVTRFVVTVLEHPSGPSGANPSEGKNHNHLNAAEAAVQGIVACPWPEFLAGSPAAPLAEAPGGEAGRRCERRVTGVRGAPLNPGDPPGQQVVPWIFDLTPVAGAWAEEGQNASFSLEPNPDPAAASATPWVTSFHAAGIAAPDGRPSVVAAVEWVPPAAAAEEEPLPAIEGFGHPPLPSFSESGGLAAELGPPLTLPPPAPAAAAPRRRVVRTAVAPEGRRAAFWAIPPQAWLAAGAGLAFVALVGVAVQSEPDVPVRRPGAVSALMAREGS